MTGIQNVENDVSLFWFAVVRKNVNKIMPGFERNWGTNLKLKSASRFKMERFESLKSLSQHRVIKYYSESISPVAFKRCYVASLDLGFELNRSSDPLVTTVTNSQIS